MYIALNSPNEPQLAQVGGKAASLIRLAQGEFNVPAGIVLPSSFFASWIETVKASDAWQTVVRDAKSGNLDLEQRAQLTLACDRAKQFTGALPFDDEQRSTLSEIRRELGEGLLAVRSSSPEEDMGGASFAGQYETVLNTKPDELEQAIRHCFGSCLDS